MRTIRTALALALQALLATASLPLAPANAQDAAAFYPGKTINLVVGVSAGGGYDQYARLLARHYARFIPGAPTIVVRNMPGAGSLSAVLFTRDVAPPDGLTLTTFNSGLLNESMSDGDKAKVRFDQFAWVGSLARDVRACMAWKDTNIRSLADFASRKQAVFGGAGPNSSSANNVAMMRNLFDLNLRIISAYRGNTEMNLAVERGELDGVCISWSSVPEDWLKNDKVNIIARLSRATSPAILAAAPFIGDVAPSQESRDVIDMLLLSGEIGRPFIMSNKVARDRVALLRKAFDEAAQDPALAAEAEKIGLPVSPVGGAEAESIVARLYGFPQTILDKARLAIKE
ncbi:MAG: tripartite tricarboxylate transporter family receptor [Hyphomicrobiales bacterium]|nr:tripartite tricarboxylate transporter family receptor [Hyphomicrobiales bacterium]